MSQAHKGSRLIVQDSILAVPFDSAHFDYNEDTAGIQRGCLVIPIGSPVYTMRPFEGKFDGAIAVEQGTTNLVAGQAIVVYNNYSVSGNITTTITTLSEKLYEQNIVRITYQPTQDANRDHMRTSSSGHGCRHNGLTFASGNTYYASIYWRSNKSSVTVVGAPSNITGWGSYVTYPLSNGWNRSVARWSSNGNGTDSKFWGISDPTINTNEVVTVDWACPQIEQKLYPTSYVSGTRAEGTLDYDIAVGIEGTISMWLYINDAIKDTVDYRHVFSVRTANDRDDGLTMFHDLSNARIRLKTVNDAGTASNIYVSDSFIPNGWRHMVARWSSTRLSFFVDGVEVGAVANPNLPTAYKAPLSVGHELSIRQMDTMISDLRVDTVAISDEEIMAMFVAESPLYNPYDNRGYAY